MFSSGTVPATFSSLTLADAAARTDAGRAQHLSPCRRTDRNRGWLREPGACLKECLKSAGGEKVEKFITLSDPLKKLGLHWGWGSVLQKG